MLNIRQCKNCWEIKDVNEFQQVIINEDFCNRNETDEDGNVKWFLGSFYDILCKDCISRIQLNSNNY